VRQQFINRAKDARPMPVCDHLRTLTQLIRHTNELRTG
jgi:hypothetical protein